MCALVSTADGNGLTELQIAVAAVFFALPESEGFLLAGGGALIAQGLVDRSTEDLDFFASRRRGDVPLAAEALARALRDRGWTVESRRTGPEFRRLAIGRSGADGGELSVDLGIDSPPDGPPTGTVAGPTLSAHDLAVRKVLALFGRAEARDFVDVYAICRRFDRDELLKAASDSDGGFEMQVFAQMMKSHRRLRDEDFPSAPVPLVDLRGYFDDWADNLEIYP